MDNIKHEYFFSDFPNLEEEDTMPPQNVAIILPTDAVSYSRRRVTWA